MRILWVVVVGTMLVAPCLAEEGSAKAPKGFKGRVFLRDGTSTEFLYLGEKGKILRHSVSGRLRGKRVSYRLSELRAVVFSDAKRRYASASSQRGDIIIESRGGDRFTLTDASLDSGGKYGAGAMQYVFADPVTKSPRGTIVSDLRSVSHITVGANRGSMKVNQKTKQYFPAFYEYDPFTGARLTWGDSARRSRKNSSK